MFKDKPAPKEQVTHLSQGDIIHMLIADKDLHVARLTLERDQALSAVASMRAENESRRRDELLRTLATDAEQAQTRHKHVVADIAARHGINWQTTAFVPETGELVALPTESP